MDLIDANWIKTHLSGRHGELKELADAAGLTPDKITKILKGERQIKAQEAPRIAHFFGDAQSGFSETGPGFLQQAVAVNASGRVQAIAAALCPDLAKPEVYRMRQAAPGVGLLANGLLVVELGMTAQPGDLVVITIADTGTDTQSTLVRRFWPPLVVPISPDDPFPAMVPGDDQASGILASVKAVARGGVLA